MRSSQPCTVPRARCDCGSLPTGVRTRVFLHLPPALTRPRARGQGRHQDCGEGGWGHPRPAGAASHGSQGAGKGPERIPRTKRIALTLLRPGRSHARAPLPSLRSRAGPRLPLAVREAHIFPSSERPSVSRQVRKANKSPAKSPRIYQSGGLSSSGRHPIRRKAASGERGAGRGAGRAAGRNTWRSGRGRPNVRSSAGPRDLRRPLPLASLCFEVLWLWPGVGVGKPGLQPAGFKGFNIRSTSSLQLLWAVLKATKGALGDFPAAQVEAATSPRTDPS